MNNYNNYSITIIIMNNYNNYSIIIIIMNNYNYSRIIIIMIIELKEENNKSLNSKKTQ
jgi:hypothetical protein